MDSDTTDVDDKNHEIEELDKDKEINALNKASDNKNETVTNAKKNKKRGRLMSWSFWIIFFIVFFNAFNIIQEGFIGISTRLGKAQAMLPPGFHAKIPFIDSVELIETRVRVLEQETQATNADQIEIKLKLTANWHLPPSTVAIFHQKYGTSTQYEQRILIPLLTSVTHGLISQYTTRELLTKRNVINQLISTAIFNHSQIAPAILDNVQIEKFILPASYQEGLEKKLTQEQVLEAEKIKASKGKIKAQADAEIAEIKANAFIKQAKAEAKAMLIKGEAKAAVIKKIIGVIQENKNYIQYEKIQKWDGKLSNSTDNPNSIFKSIEK
jgi:regulator of protease activity HflC (stomatin/prohibitin superfamily)